jgi:hypothetical protein
MLSSRSRKIKIKQQQQQTSKEFILFFFVVDGNSASEDALRLRLVKPQRQEQDERVRLSRVVGISKRRATQAASSPCTPYGTCCLSFF